MHVFLPFVGGLIGLRSFVEQQSFAAAAAWALQSATTLKLGAASETDVMTSTSSVGALLTIALRVVVGLRVATWLVGMVGFKASHTPSQKGRRVIVTGASNGIGFDTALELGRVGAHVTLACRNEKRGTDAIKRMKSLVPEGTFDLLLVDLGDFASVQHAAEEYLERLGPKGALNTLINNAGVSNFATRRSSTQGDFELQMASNHIGHFLLVELLKPALERAEKPRIVHVSSLAAWSGATSNMGAASLSTSAADYKPMDQYSHTKLAQHWFSREFRRRNPTSKIMSVVCHPGGSSTNLMADSAYGDAKITMGLMKGIIMQSAAAGAWPTLLAATAPYEKLSKNGTSVFAPMFAMAGPATAGMLPPNAKDATAAKQAEFWEASMNAVKAFA